MAIQLTLWICLCLVACLVATVATGSRQPASHLAKGHLADYSYGQGYIEAGSNGGVYAFGNEVFRGSTFSEGGSAQQIFGEPIVGVAAAVGNTGYWVTSSNGGVCGFGSTVPVYNLPGNNYGVNGCWYSEQAATDIVGVAGDPVSDGYWLVGADGGIFNYDNAGFWGSAAGDLHLSGSNPTGPAVGVAATPDGGGYWIVTSRGYIYAFGDAVYESGINGGTINKPIVSIAAGPNDSGYTMAGGDGGTYAYGSAPFLGSTGQTTSLYYPIVGIASTPDGEGIYLMAYDGSVVSYGESQFQGDIYGSTNGQIVGIAYT